MKVAVFGNFIVPSRVGGAEQALYNLVRGFLEIGIEVDLILSKGQQLAEDFIVATKEENKLSFCYSGMATNRMISEQIAIFIKFIIFTDSLTDRRCGSF